MKVVCDSSGCCAIKHIRDFCYIYPDKKISKPYLTEGHDQDQSSSAPDPHSNWESTETLRHEMTGEEYFRALVAQIKDRRPQGMITANLAMDRQDDNYCCEDCNGMSYEEFHSQQDTIPKYDTTNVERWDGIFKSEGFTRRDFVNSNSYNMICHYELIYGQ